MEKWYCAKIDVESLAISACKAIGFATFIPKYIAQDVVHRRIVQKKRSVFPGYMLLRFDARRDPWEAIYYARGVDSLIIENERPVPVRDDAVYELQARCRGGELIEDMPVAMTRLWQVGQRLMVVEGVWQGRECVVDRVWDDQDRVDVLIALFGEQRVQLKNGMLEAVA